MHGVTDEANSTHHNGQCYIRVTKMDRHITEYLNMIQACIDAVFKHSPTASHRKHGGFSLKEEGHNDGRFVITQKYGEYIYILSTEIIS